MKLKLTPIAYFLLIAHFIFFTIVGGYAFYVAHPHVTLGW